MKWLYLVAMLLLFAGCGDVNWFPDNTTSSSSGGTSANATGPNAFQFAAKTTSIANAAGVVVSDPVTMVGNNPNGWAISLSDSPSSINSTVLIDGVFFIKGNTIPNIKPGQALQIQQEVPAVIKTGDKLSTIVTVGTTTTEFVTTVQ